VSQRVLIAKHLQSRLGPDSEYRYEVTYYLWCRKRSVPWFAPSRRRRSAADDNDGEYTYEIWVVAIPGQLSVDHELGAESASGPDEDLKQAIADVAADRVTGAIWKIDDLSADQAAVLIGMPEKLQGLVDEPLAAAAAAAGMGDFAAEFTGQVAGAMLLRPVMEPVESTLRGLEIVGVIAGLVTGLHGLSALCMKHLIHDKITKMLGDAFSQAISNAIKAPDRASSAAAGPGADGRSAEPATASGQPATFGVTHVTADSEDEVPRRRTRLRFGRWRAAHEDDIREAVARTVASEETTQRLRRGKDLHHHAAAGGPMDTPSAGLLGELPLPENPPTAVSWLSTDVSSRGSRPGRAAGPSRYRSSPGKTASCWCTAAPMTALRRGYCLTASPIRSNLPARPRLGKCSMRPG